MGLLWLVRSVWLRLASEEIMFSMMRSCIRLRVVAHKPLLALLHAYTRLARTTAQGLMSDAKASPVASEVQFRAANKTPWRCCVTLPYCLHCLHTPSQGRFAGFC